LLKRIFDLLIVCAALPLASILIVILTVLIRLDSPGPALFRQKRVGLGEKEFTLLKLRTMTLGTGDVPSHEADSHKVTRMGYWLRRMKLDELPQLFNVLSGAMALVGPRPCLPSQLELREARRALDVFALRPGVTGLAQVRGIDMSTPQQLAKVDAEYRREKSFATDFSILLATLRGRGSGDAIEGSNL
jgi:O-antigen biosynthesis protein WbqP